jgi:PII-like signaling protein
MTQPENATLLRLYVGEKDRFDHRPLYEAIVLRAREHGLAGATVMRGLLGFGASSLLHTAKILRLSDDLPIVIEIVDTDDRIESFLPVLDEMMPSGLATIETVRIVPYNRGGKT